MSDNDFAARLAALGEKEKRELQKGSPISNSAMEKAAKFLDLVGKLDKTKRAPVGTGQRDNLAALLTNPQNQNIKPPGREWNYKTFAPNIVGGALSAIADHTPIDETFKVALEGISRPAYGTFEAMKERSESLAEGQNEFQALDDIVGGLWSGLSGKEKTGFGEVVEANAARGQMPGQTKMPGILGTILDQGFDTNYLPEDGPIDLRQNAKRAQGLVGEVGLDPLNFIGGSAVATKGSQAAKVVRKTNKASEAISKVLPKVDDARIYNPVEYVDDVQAKVTDSLKEEGWFDLVNKKKNVTFPTGGIDGKAVSIPTTVHLNALNDEIAKSIADTSIQINKGANAFKVIGAEHVPHTTSARIVKSVRQLATSELDDTSRLMAHASGRTTLKVSKLKGLEKEAFKRYQELILSNYKHTNRLTATTKEKRMQEAIDETLNALDEDMGSLYRNLVGKLDNEVWNSPGIRVGDKRIPMARVGRAYANAKGKHLSGEGWEKLSHAKQFKGRLQLLNRRVSSLGVRNYENWHVGKNGVQTIDGIRKGEKSLISMANTLNASQRKAITKSVLEGNRPTDDAMAAAYDWLKDEYDTILREEFDAGVLGKFDKKTHVLDTGPVADNYVNLYFRRGNPRKIREFKNTVKASIAKDGHMPEDVYELAKAKGLHPIEDAFEALTFRKLKSNRRLTESFFMDDLMEHYGVSGTRQSVKLNNMMDLRDVTERLPVHVRKELSQQGHRAYLPQEIEDIFIKYRDLSRSKNVESWLRTVDSVTRLFKFSATIPFPGFHIRNAMGDMFMGFLDGVKPSDYKKTATRLAKARNNPTYQVTLEGHTHNFQELKDLFNSHTRTGGYFRTDLGTSELGRAIFDPTKATRKAYDFVRRGSEFREDFFRFNHFLRAYGEEYAALTRQIKDPKLLKRNASENASFRVNKYLFDYSALTKTERDVMRRVIPFYTYQRKVLPTILESLFLAPRNLAVTNRAFDPSADNPDNFNPMLIPGYHREAGYATLDDSEEPWIWSAMAFPTDPVRQNTDFNDPQAWLRDLLSQTNPAIKAPIELATGTSLFDEKPIDDPAMHLQGAFFPPIAALADTLNPEDGALAEALTSRFGLGLPIDKVSESQMDSTLYTQSAEVKRNLSAISNRLVKEKGLRIYLSDRKDGASFRIRNEETGEVIFESENVNEVIQVAKNLAG